MPGSQGTKALGEGGCSTCFGGFGIDSSVNLQAVASMNTFISLSLSIYIYMQMNFQTHDNHFQMNS